MAVKFTIQGLLIYATMVVYLVAFVVTVVRLKKAGHVLFTLGFAIGVLSYGYRWFDARHIPLQNLFEVFLFLGVICWPLSWFCRGVLKVGGQNVDMLLGVIVLFPTGFVFNANPQHLPPALQSWLFTPHVAVYMLAYLLMAKAAVQAVCQLIRGARKDVSELVAPEQATYRMVCAGFPLLTLGLVLGSVWGKLAWGDYWAWDPKELWSLASWLVYLGYFHFRYMYGKKLPWINSIWALTGMAAIVVTLLWVNLAKIFAGLHSYAT